MAGGTVPRVVVVTRRTEYQGLLARHATREQARFFLETRGQSIETIEARHAALERADKVVGDSIPQDWRKVKIDRDDLDRFLFEPRDLIVVVGQDGLVANVAKYLEGQPVLGVDPEPGRNAGVLVRHEAKAVEDLLQGAAAERQSLEERTMVEAQALGGPRLLALNELFIGQPTHQSARYSIELDGASERQSSSGVIVASGTGATGWAASIHRERAANFDLPAPCAQELAWFVREAWPSPATGTACTQGILRAGESLRVVSEMDRGVVFGDGIESDCLTLSWGQPVTIRRAEERLRLVV